MNKAQPKTMAALKRKIERLEAQLKAAHDFMQRDRAGEFAMILQNADMLERMKQAAALLAGGDA